jgi:hypothetical protein
MHRSTADLILLIAAISVSIVIIFATAGFLLMVIWFPSPIAGPLGQGLGQLISVLVGVIFGVLSGRFGRDGKSD